MNWRARVKGGAGFTLIETMIAMLVLTVGVLGTLSLIDASNAASRTTRQREAATNLARQLVEDSRKLSWSSLTPSAISPALQALPGLADSDGSMGGWQITVKGITFTVTATACSLDDPADSLGVHGVGVTWCAGQSASTTDLQPEDYRRVTITVTSPQSSRVGVITQSDVISLQSVSQADVASGAGPGAGLALTGAPCTNCDATAYGQKRISPCSGAGNAFGFGGTCNSPTIAQTTTSISSVGFVANFTATPASVTWAIDGVDQGNAAGSGTGPWTFTWTLGTTYPQVPVDGRYQVTAQAYDPAGKPTGAAASMYVRLDRFIPDAAAYQIFAGRNQQWGTASVDIEAEPTAGVGRIDRDVKQYRVFRCDSTCASYADVPSLAITPVAPTATPQTNVTEKTDSSAPAQAVLKYQIYAVDTDSNGNVSRLGGGPKTSADVKLANAVPKVAVAPFYAANCVSVACTYLGQGPFNNLHWAPPTQPDDTDSASGDCLKFFRIYRALTSVSTPTIADRYARTGGGGGASLAACENAQVPQAPHSTGDFGDWDYGGVAHKYWVTSVDTKMGESAPVLIGTI
jgi:type II secretory pathway pseudopilin PulG